MEKLKLNNGVEMRNFGLGTYLIKPEDAEITVREGLKMGFIDLLFIHQPGENYMAGYKQLEKAYKEGKIKAIGISNFEGKYIEELLQNYEIKPQVIQVEAHPYYTQDELRKI